MKILVVEGNILDQQTDIIVNATHPALNLAKGGVSRAILEAAGQTIQTECKNKYPTGISIGDVAVTSGGDLSVKHIYHIALGGRWETKQQEIEQTLRSVIQECLKMTENEELTSIAFPALGTGKLGYPPEKVAEIMLDVALSFNSEKLTDVLIVVHPSASDIIKVFKAELEKRMHTKTAESKERHSIEDTTESKGRTEDTFQTGCANRRAENPEILKKGFTMRFNEDLKDRGWMDEILVLYKNGTLASKCRVKDNVVICKVCRWVKYGTETTRIKGKPTLPIGGNTEWMLAVPENTSTSKINWFLFDSAEELMEWKTVIDSLKIIKEGFTMRFNEDFNNRGWMDEKLVLHRNGALVSESLVKDNFVLCEDVPRGVKYGIETAGIKGKPILPIGGSTEWMLAAPGSCVADSKINWFMFDSSEELMEWKVVLDSLKTLTMKVERKDAQSLDANKPTEEEQAKILPEQKLDRNGSMDVTSVSEYDHGVRQASKQDSALSIPEFWTDQLCQNLELTEDEAKDVITSLETSMTTSDIRATVIKVQRIQNHTLYKQYQIQKDTMNEENQCEDNERLLWHGTSTDSINNINKNGFNRSYRGKNATRYGQGVYFARDANYSLKYATPDDYGKRYIYMVKVLTGKYTTGHRTMRDAPIRVASESIHYDSVVNDEEDPSIFVIFKDAHAYPVYLVTFTMSGLVDTYVDLINRHSASQK